MSDVPLDDFPDDPHDECRFEIEQLERIVELTKQMRQAQKLFFKTKATSALEESKRLEREVDFQIQRRDETQMSLF